MSESEKKTFGHIRTPLKRVHMELTNVCDFNCVFCPKSVMTRPYGYMDTDLAMRTLTELRENGICEKVTFHVMGEPTLHPRFFDILAHARDVGMKVGLTTNGGRLGGETGSRLLDFGLHQLDISLQTPDERSFSLRKAGRLTFGEYVSGILGFFARYHERWPETVIKLRFMNTRFKKRSMAEKTGMGDVISTTDELRDTFRKWAGRIYDLTGASREARERALRSLDSLVSYKWNVVEISPNVFFETYVLEDWGHAFDREGVRDAWAGYCFGMRDHFSILHNGDVALCCIDYDGKTRMGNLNEASLKEILSSEELGRIIKGFEGYRVLHPYCKKCLGSRSFATWLLKPVLSVTALKLLKPFFYSRTSAYK